MTTLAQTTATDSTSEADLTNMATEEFKHAVGATAFDVVKNPKNGKLFISANNGKVYRCQQEIDLSGRVSFLIPDGILENACFVNSQSSNIVASF